MHASSLGSHTQCHAQEQLLHPGDFGDLVKGPYKTSSPGFNSFAFTAGTIVNYTVVGGGELQVYDRSAVTVSDGMLHLTARREEKYGVDYVSGLVQTGGNDTTSDEPKFNFLSRAGERTAPCTTS